jgi:branched-chain amino acid transport system permease protein
VSSWFTVLSLGGINCIFALSAYVIFMTGQVSLAQAAFIAIGAFLSATGTVLWGLPIVPAVIIGGVGAAALGLLVGFPVLRLKGLHLTIATVAFTEVVRVVFHNMKYGRPMIFPGQEGVQKTAWLGPDGPLGFRYISYVTDHHITTGQYAAWIWLLVVGFLLFFALLERSRMGYAMRAVEQDEAVAQTIGMNRTYVKVVAFVLGAFMAGIGGGLYAHLLTFISGNDFGIPLSVIVLAYAVIGGSGTYWGPVMGAFVFTLLPEILRPIKDYRLEVFGLLMMLTMVFRPEGMLTRDLVARIAGVGRSRRAAAIARELGEAS